MGALGAKCAFTFYNDIEEHKCKSKRMRKSVYYKSLSALTTDLNCVNASEKYQKKTVCIPSKCTCSGNIVQLQIHNQMAISHHYIPNVRYEYKTKQVVDTKPGFIYWLYNITRELWKNDSEFDMFISGLVPGVLFYDGVYIKKIARKIQQEGELERFIVRGELDFYDTLKKFIKYAEELNDNSVVTNYILKNKQ